MVTAHFKQRVRSRLRQLLREHEGCVRHAYQDHLGYWTIGVGRLIDERKGGGVSDDEVAMLLENDIENVLSQLEHTIPDWSDLPEGVQVALASMAFQMGVSGLFGFRRMLAHIEAKNWTEAAREALNSKWAHQTPSRASEIAEMIRNG